MQVHGSLAARCVEPYVHVNLWHVNMPVIHWTYVSLPIFLLPNSLSCKSCLDSVQLIFSFSALVSPTVLSGGHTCGQIA